MTSSSAIPLRPQDLLRGLRAHPWRLLAPGVLGALAALAVVLIRPATWEATQALIVRDEAAGSSGGGGRTTHPGQFGQADPMKAVQETILELSHSRGVLEQSMKEVGPPPKVDQSVGWPTIRDVESLQDQCKLVPPKGAEFGKTELFYLKVRAEDKARALALAAAISHNLQARFEELRKTRAQGVTRELEKSVSLAKADLQQATQSLAGMEVAIGRDLAELRMLNESPSGDSDLRKMTVDLETELRTQRSTLKANKELLRLLKQGQADPGRLLATPSRLLESQPGIKRLKEGLVDAQLASAKLQGLMSGDHPQVRAARTSEQEISQNLHDELEIAIRGVEGDVRLGEDRLQTLEQERQRIEQRRNRVASVRADYANLVSMTKHHTEIVKAAQLQLSEARATEASAHQSALLNLVDLPEIGSRPTGPGRSVIVLGGLVGGLALGAAWLFLTLAGVEPTPGESEQRVAMSQPRATLLDPAVEAAILPSIEAPPFNGSAKEAWSKLIRKSAAGRANFGPAKP